MLLCRRNYTPTVILFGFVKSCVFGMSTPDAIQCRQETDDGVLNSTGVIQPACSTASTGKCEKRICLRQQGVGAYLLYRSPSHYPPFLEAFVHVLIANNLPGVTGTRPARDQHVPVFFATSGHLHLIICFIVDNYLFCIYDLGQVWFVGRF